MFAVLEQVGRTPVRYHGRSLERSVMQGRNIVNLGWRMDARYIQILDETTPLRLPKPVGQNGSAGYGRRLRSERGVPMTMPSVTLRL